MFIEIPTRTQVLASATVVKLLSPNGSRNGAVIYNSSGSATLYIIYGIAGTPTGSLTDYTLPLPPSGFLVLQGQPDVYQGQINGIWSSADSSYTYITELV
jgi:hypothetical protein